MDKIELKRGDVFASSNPQSLGVLIRLMQKIRARDRAAVYSHTGIIQDSFGRTLEAVMTITEQNLFEAYKGDKVLIARWVGMDMEAYQKGYAAIKHQIGRRYPFQRLFWHLLGVSRWVHVFKTPVCSELTEMFLYNAGAVTMSGGNFWGLNPDDLVDEWRVSKHFEIVFEGVITAP